MADDLVELEIAAFMGPHIKRARLVLAIIGVLYVSWGLYNYSDIAHLRADVARWTAGASHDPRLEAIEHAVNVAYVVVVALIVGGIANIVLAAVAGAKTMPAFHAAAAIFVVQTALQIYAAGLLALTSALWWLAVIALAIGYMAAIKAEHLRASAKAATATASA